MIFRAKYSIYKLLVNFGLGESIDIASILTVSFNFREIQLGLMFLFFFFSMVGFLTIFIHPLIPPLRNYSRFDMFKISKL